MGLDTQTRRARKGSKAGKGWGWGRGGAGGTGEEQKHRPHYQSKQPWQPHTNDCYSIHAAQNILVSPEHSNTSVHGTTRKNISVVTHGDKKTTTANSQLHEPQKT